MTHPNFFLVGAARSGTTSLWQYLRDHPDIFLPEALPGGKEPSFFCDLTPPWARDYRELDKYLSLFARARGRKAVGEASTGYLVSPESATRIRQQYPDAKIIIVLRHPVARAHSLYRYLCFWGLESAASFEKALAREHDRFENERFKRRTELLYYAFLYVNSGMYSAQLKRYFDAFGQSQVHIVLHDDLKANALEVVQGVYRFLGVDADHDPPLTTLNQSQFPLSVRVQHFLGRRWNAHPLVPRQPIRRRDRLHIPVAFGINTLLGTYRRERMKVPTRQMLLKQFRDDIEKTGVLINRNLNSWVEERG